MRIVFFMIGSFGGSFGTVHAAVAPPTYLHV